MSRGCAHGHRLCGTLWRRLCAAFPRRLRAALPHRVLSFVTPRIHLETHHGHHDIAALRRAGGCLGRGRFPLAGAGGCAAYDVVLILKRGRHEVTGCQVELEAQRADTDPKVFTRIHLHFVVTGSGVRKEHVERRRMNDSRRLVRRRLGFGLRQRKTGSRRDTARRMGALP